MMVKGRGKLKAWRDCEQGSLKGMCIPLRINILLYATIIITIIFYNSASRNFRGNLTLRFF